MQIRQRCNWLVVGFVFSTIELVKNIPVVAVGQKRLRNVQRIVRLYYKWILYTYAHMSVLAFFIFWKSPTATTCVSILSVGTEVENM